MIKDYCEQFFKDDYSTEEITLILKAFIDPTRIVNKKEVKEDNWVFFLKVNSEIPYCLVVEFPNDGDRLFFKICPDFESGKLIYDVLIGLSNN